ncbi:MAG: response regulator [Lentisphaerae bacterium]|nr:response regulator [Lentisphaerota bacterium]
MPGRVLLIDDELQMLNMLKTGLETVGGFEVHIANSGKEGIQLARRLNPDVIILDICMPKMNGIEVLRTLKSKHPVSGIPVIMLSSLSDESTKMECNYEYGEEYIQKPVAIAELKKRIDSVLARTGRR